MAFTSLVLQKLLATNAHLGRRVASRHSDVFVYGFRNEVAILDSDKTLVCLRNALHFLGSLFRENGRVLIVNTNSLFDEITDQTASKLGRSCLNDAQWMNLLSSSKNRRIRISNTRKAGGRSIMGGVPSLRPDCVVVMNAERESSAILEAARNQIPVVSLVESDISLGLYKRITYPVPANDSVQFVYLFCNLIAKTWYCSSQNLSSRLPVSESHRLEN
uniref:Ribosomal protein S2 n=1 Tax=Taxus cuspidata TaxID=99806 RepID=A0A6B9XMU4_TAXCU|nr:ribosomal protein S2 [Taxus cuspidata]